MTEERLIEIIRRVSYDDRFIILLDGQPVEVNGDEIWMYDEEGRSYHHYLNTLKIERNRDEFISISLDGSWYELEICEKRNINNL